MPKRKTLLVELQPSGPVTQAAEPIPVLVTLTYVIGLGTVEDVEAVALAWTAREVLVRPLDWEVAEPVWIPSGDVRRA